MKRLVVAIAAVALGAGTASWADKPVFTKAPAMLPTWTGFYLGIETGGAWGRSKHVDQITGLDDVSWFDVMGPRWWHRRI